MRLPAMFVCLSVCLSVRSITQKRVHIDLDEILRVDRCRHIDEVGRTDQLLSPESVKQAPHTQQATGHVMHCRETLSTPLCSPRATEFHGLVNFSV